MKIYVLLCPIVDSKHDYISSTLFRIKNKLCGTFYPNIDIFNNIIFQPSCHCNEF